MSTKNVALSTEVYEKLAGFKRTSESFSKAIERLLAAHEGQNTCAEILKGLSTIPPLSEDDARKMLKVVEENRAGETWTRDDLR